MIMIIIWIMIFYFVNVYIGTYWYKVKIYIIIKH